MILAEEQDFVRRMKLCPTCMVPTQMSRRTFGFLLTSFLAR